MDITSILENVGGFISGGAISGLLTWKYARKEAEANAMEKVQAIYSKLTTDLVTEIERLKTEVELLRKDVDTLSRRAGMACYRAFCTSRIFNEIKYQLESNEDNTEPQR